MSDRTTPKTKKERIREMILKGLGPEEIRDTLKTSIDYVYKEKGKLKKEGLLITQQTLSVTTGQHDLTFFKDQSNQLKDIKIERPVRIHTSSAENGEYDIPPLDKDNLMLMYQGFDNNEGPIYPIAQLGVHPSISQKEYLRFLAMKSRDPFSLQNKLANEIANPSPEIKLIIEKSANELLTNDEILSLIDFKIKEYANSYLMNVIFNPAIKIPYGLERPICGICHAAQPGVLFETSTPRGYFTERIISHAPCPMCVSKQSMIYQKG
jgi:hypothetical protein